MPGPVPVAGDPAELSVGAARLLRGKGGRLENAVQAARWTAVFCRSWRSLPVIIIPLESYVF